VSLIARISICSKIVLRYRCTTTQEKLFKFSWSQELDCIKDSAITSDISGGKPLVARDMVHYLLYSPLTNAIITQPFVRINETQTTCSQRTYMMPYLINEVMSFENVGIIRSAINHQDAYKIMASLTRKRLLTTSPRISRNRVLYTPKMVRNVCLIYTYLTML